MLTLDEQHLLAAELVNRPGREKVRALLRRLFVDELGADSRDIDFEKPAHEVHGCIDALLGRSVFELKSDLRRERRDAENGLARYLSEREATTSSKYVGITTDGAEFIVFFLRGDGVVEVSAHRTDQDKPRELMAWLQCTVAVSDGLQPDPTTITREFGRDSLAAPRALDDLDELWTNFAQTPHARLKRELWNRLLILAYGADVGDHTLFLQHTYLVVAKAVAWSAMIGAPPPDAAALLHGTAFSELGIVGQSEPDFFDWVLDADGGPDLVMRIQRQVNRFPLRDIRVDILKALYESLMDTWDEARYLCGILNSEALRSPVHQYQAQGQFGARHFDKYVFNLPIPPLHRTRFSSPGYLRGRDHCRIGSRSHLPAGGPAVPHHAQKDSRGAGRARNRRSTRAAGDEPAERDLISMTTLATFVAPAPTALPVVRHTMALTLRASRIRLTSDSNARLPTGRFSSGVSSVRDRRPVSVLGESPNKSRRRLAHRAAATATSGPHA